MRVKVIGAGIEKEVQIETYEEAKKVIGYWGAKNLVFKDDKQETWSGGLVKVIVFFED